MRRILQALRRFRAREDGNGTLEFLLILPFFMLFATSSYEAGLLSTRQVMLERGMDMTIRDVRIGRIPVPTNEILTQQICDHAKIIPNCMADLRLEMLRRDPRNWTDIGPVECVDRSLVNQPVVNFTNTGTNNDLMVLRACLLLDPMLPTSGLGKAIPKKSGGAFAIVATSSYVMEPFQR